jgi:hypothetical protein
MAPTLPELEAAEPNMSYEKAWMKFVRDETRYMALLNVVHGSQVSEAERARASVLLSRRERPCMPRACSYPPRPRVPCPCRRCHRGGVYEDKAGGPRNLEMGRGGWGYDHHEGWWTKCCGCGQETRWAGSLCPEMAGWQHNPPGWLRCPSCQS